MTKEQLEQEVIYWRCLLEEIMQEYDLFGDIFEETLDKVRRALRERE